MAVIKKIKIPGETLPRDIGVNSSNVVYDGDSGTTTTLNSKIQSIFTAIGDINSFEIALVNALPTENIDDHTIYFVPNSQDANTRDEYMYVGNQWEMIGSTTIDLSDYPTYDDISIVQGLTTGIPAATITVGATTTTIYTTDGSNHMVKGVDYVTAGQVNGATLGTKATAEGLGNRASGNYSHAEGDNNTASKQSSHAEGRSNTASGLYSHAEGTGNTASGSYSHAEGNSNTASGIASHAEGTGSKALGTYSHAEGYRSTASGDYSHAEGLLTTAQRRSQHVFGEYNILDNTGTTTTRGNYVEIVGNGNSSTTLSNARTLDWDGNEWVAGKVTVSNITPTADGDLTSKSYVDSQISSVTSTIPTVTPAAALTTGITIGSIDVNGVTTTLYAPEDTKVTQTDVTGSTENVKYPVLLSAQTTTAGTITDEASKSDTFTFNRSVNTLIVRRSSNADLDGRFTVTTLDGNPQVDLCSFKVGTTTQVGVGLVNLGNSIASGTAGNAKGLLQIYGENTRANRVWSLATTEYYDNYLPKVDEAILAAGVTTGVGSSTVPVYMASTGELIACSLPTPVTPPTYSLSMTGPTINLLADGVAASTITLPIYDGTVIEAAEGGSY